MSNSRRYIRGAVALVVALGIGSTALPASADRNSINDKKRQQQQVRQQRALIASQINTLQASDRQIESALKALNANVQGTQAELESAQNALAQANHDAEVARQGIESATNSITSLQTTLAGLAVDSYVHPLGDTMLAVLNTTNISDAAQKRAFLTVVHQRDADVADQIKQAREDLTTQREAAQDAASRAESSRQAITAQLQKLHDAQAQQQQFEDKVQARLDAALSESAVLESQDKQLATEIARDQAALAAQLRARRGGGRGTALPPIGNINVVNVDGIYVNAQIADNLERAPRRGAGRWSAALRMGLPRHERADRPAPGALRLEPIRDLRDALVPVLTPDRAARRLDARAWAGDRLHVQRRDDRQSQQPWVQMARRPRVAVRPLQPAVGALALVDERQLTLLSGRGGAPHRCLPL